MTAGPRGTGITGSKRSAATLLVAVLVLLVALAQYEAYRTYSDFRSGVVVTARVEGKHRAGPARGKCYLDVMYSREENGGLSAPSQGEVVVDEVAYAKARVSSAVVITYVPAKVQGTPDRLAYGKRPHMQLPAVALIPLLLLLWPLLQYEKRRRAIA